ncbi:MAG: UDP-N-acetylmuramoyl-L-alanine--D-glutamate ligase, partial [Caldilineaceae bacterium]|nr:UDP-N-acetylmuramoyl-L-alanine--D-glutamate ligase [Caldilineaceae bacterium]
MTTNFEFANRKIVILGLARQGVALARFFAHAGAQVVVSDRAAADKLAAEMNALDGLAIEYVLGGHPDTLLQDCALLCLSGGVPPQLEIVQKAIAQGIPLSNDSLLTFQLARARGLGPLVAITGSSGKTTTTTLVGQMLAETAGRRGKKVHVGGNIGQPLIDRLPEIAPGEPIVLELSSFQLELFDPQIAWGAFTQIGPDVAALLNITPNHLDRHPSMAAYAQAKLNLLRFLPANATVVLSADDAVTARLAPGDNVQSELPRLEADWKLDEPLRHMGQRLADQALHVVLFSREHVLNKGAWVEDDALRYEGYALCAKSELQLRGEHNVSNVLAAAAISGAAGAEAQDMATVARRFTGVAHRLEVAAQQDGITWINDSIATSPERSLAGLRCFERGAQTLILLVGGRDKKLDWHQLANEVIKRVDFLIGFGEAGP